MAATFLADLSGFQHPEITDSSVASPAIFADLDADLSSDAIHKQFNKFPAGRGHELPILNRRVYSVLICQKTKGPEFIRAFGRFRLAGFAQTPEPCSFIILQYCVRKANFLQMRSYARQSQIRIQVSAPSQGMKWPVASLTGIPYPGSVRISSSSREALYRCTGIMSYHCCALSTPKSDVIIRFSKTIDSIMVSL